VPALIGRVLVDVCMTHQTATHTNQQGHYPYMQPHHHQINHTHRWTISDHFNKEYAYTCIASVCVCVCVYRYVCIDICVCVYVWMCVFMCVCVCIDICVCVYICVSVCMYIYIYVCVCVCMYMCVCVCVCVCGPGSSVGIATDYRLDCPGSNPGGDEIFRPSRPAWGPTNLV